MADWKAVKGKIVCREEHINPRKRHFVVKIGDVTQTYENEGPVHCGRNLAKEAGDMYSQFMKCIISNNPDYADQRNNRPGVTLPAPVFPEKLKSRITDFVLLK